MTEKPTVPSSWKVLNNPAEFDTPAGATVEAETSARPASVFKDLATISTDPAQLLPLRLSLERSLSSAYARQCVLSAIRSWAANTDEKESKGGVGLLGGGAYIGRLIRTVFAAGVGDDVADLRRSVDALLLKEAKSDTLADDSLAVQLAAELTVQLAGLLMHKTKATTTNGDKAAIETNAQPRHCQLVVLCPPQCSACESGPCLAFVPSCECEPDARCYSRVASTRARFAHASQGTEASRSPAWCVQIVTAL